jgi:hypothetical protein
MTPRILCIALVGAVMALPAGSEPIGPAGQLKVAGGQLCDQTGRPLRLYGVNLFQSHLLWSRSQKASDYEADLVAIAANGFNAVRMPLNMGWFEPAQGVFPDSPEYNDVMAKHRLPTGAIAFYDGLIKRAGELGLYVIPEFHELPTDPYRWFVGGEERDRGTDKPGTAISWLGVPIPGQKGRYQLDATLASAELPRALGWLANHLRDVPNIAAIEIPWNEPGGPLTEGQAYFDLCRACARAVKTADPQRLVFMDAVDWGAMVNRLADEATWKLPDEVDGLFPHFYPGMHSGNSGPEGTWSVTMANWLSWMLGSGRPVMVGEYGVVEMGRARYWQSDVTDTDRANTYAACVAQWNAMGAQGLFCWAWGGGIGRDKATGALNQGAEQLPKWAAACREPAAAPAIAVVCNARRRSSYGDRKDLWRITEALLDAHLAPFATVFDRQVLAQPDCLKRFRAVIVLNADLVEGTADAVRAQVPDAYWLSADMAELNPTVEALCEKLPPPDLPANVLVGYAPGRATVFERKGAAGDVRLRLRIPAAAGEGRLTDEDGKVLFAGTAEKLTTEGVMLPLQAWQCVLLRWQQ